jgi:asparagine synthase (glutamine-hydrolysing)
MAKMKGPAVRTFTIDFHEKTFSEVEDAQCVADHCGSEHHVLQVTTDAMSLLPELIWHFDEPFADSSAIPTYYVSKMAAEHVTVILSGDGGDELFAGYNNYAKRDQYRLLMRLPKAMRYAVFNRMAKALPIYAPMRNFLKYVANANRDDGPGALGLFPYLKEDLLTPDVNNVLAQFDAMASSRELLKSCAIDDKLARLQYADTKHYLPGDILVKVDRMSMAHSLETRAPLLDYRLAEFAARLPMSLRMQSGTGKYLLKKVMRTYLPDRILRKPKHGFSVPIGPWLQTSLKEFAKAILLDQRSRRRGLFNTAVVARVLDYHAQGRRDYSTWIWTLLILELWFQTYMDSSTRRI